MNPLQDKPAAVTESGGGHGSGISLAQGLAAIVERVDA
ncbi:hypothetical protein BN12_270023 [Nostocoides japonicum T1-X7]|uniref:Uncharacterized protein n=1 Tax=Nostocoides japonicum T1-X7 TaxID=1194083 RepID=A0A077LZJ1_9MICO|nr:hypothetical protein BN12_270023 [Tetrasphaera japonica T1-X7]